MSPPVIGVNTPPPYGAVKNQSFIKHLDKIQVKNGIMPRNSKPIANISTKTCEQIKLLYKDLESSSALQNNINMDDNEFIQPKRFMTTHPSTSQNSITTNNRFGVLDSIDTENMDYSNSTYEHQSNNGNDQQQPNTMQTKNYKPPPITIKSKLDYVKFHNDINELVGKDKYWIRYNGNTTKIYPKDLNTHNILFNNFKESKIECHTFTPKENRQHKLVLKAAPHFPPEMVKSSLQQNNIEVIDCTKLLSKRHSNSNSFLITTANKGAVKQLRAVEDMENVKLEWQKYHKKTTVTQCYRCQQYGHGSTNCTMAPRCLKCARHHLTKDCDMPSRCEENLDKLKCANCNGPHPANFNQCPIRVQYMERTNLKVSVNNNVPKNILNMNQFPTLPRTQNTPTFHTQTYSHNAQPTYANVTSKDSNENISLSSLMQELKELNQICNLNELFSIIRELKTGLAQCQSTLDKIQFIAQIASKYSL